MWRDAVSNGLSDAWVAAVPASRAHQTAEDPRLHEVFSALASMDTHASEWKRRSVLRAVLEPDLQV